MKTQSHKNQVQETTQGSGIESEDVEREHPLPPNFPPEESFEAFICYKCVEKNPWIKQYAGTAGFLPPVYKIQDGEKGQASSNLGQVAET